MRDHVLIGNIEYIIAEMCMSLVTVFICGFGDFFFDHTKEKSLICKYCSEFFNLGKKIVVLCKESVSFKSGESSQSHVDNCLSLNIIKSESCNEFFLSFSRSCGSSDNADDFIDEIKSFEETLENMISFFRFAEIVFGTSCYNIFLMLQILLKNFEKC